ncbi:MAG: ATP-dependent DNA ligase [Candidatus Micrarchaeota archaeon]|nr:ATP-dependent DNA ligase [Candidatus Micrarchaeota archaeon]
MLFSELCSYWEKIEATSSRLEMAKLFAELLSKLKREEVRPVIYLSEGLLLPSHHGLELGLGIKLMFDAISFSTGYPIKKIEQLFKQKGDIGLVAQELFTKKLQASLFEKKLEIAEVYSILKSLAELSGKGSQEAKLKQLSELLNSSSPSEAKYLARFCVGTMRLGIGEPTIIDSLASIRIKKILSSLNGLEYNSQFYSFESSQALSALDSPTLELNIKSSTDLEFLEEKNVSLVFQEGKTALLKVSKIKQVEDGYIFVFEQFKKTIRYPIERAFNFSNDLGKVAEYTLFDYKKIEEFKIEVFSPLRPALAERLSNAQEIIEKIGPCAADAKYDGFRLQIHKEGKRVELYSRKLEKVSASFPEICKAVEGLALNSCIFEGEAVAYNPKEKKYYPFQMTIKRKRKYQIEKMQQELPLHLFVFDLLYADGIDYSNLAFEQRRKELQRLIKEKPPIFHSDLKLVSNAAELQNFFEKCIKNGLEGIIAKDLSSPYIAGAREFAWIKLKKSYGKLADSIDAVIVGYYLGKGQRAEFNFGGLLVAVKNSQTQKLETIAKLGSGFSEEEMKNLENILSKIKIDKKPPQLISNLIPDFWVEPKIVVSITADEISLSPIHTCNWKNNKGFALRFPRMLSIRTDKGIDEITTSQEIQRLYLLQFSSKPKQ